MGTRFCACVCANTYRAASFLQEFLEMLNHFQLTWGWRFTSVLKKFITCMTENSIMHRTTKCVEGEWRRLLVYTAVRRRDPNSESSKNPHLQQELVLVCLGPKVKEKNIATVGFRKSQMSKITLIFDPCSHLRPICQISHLGRRLKERKMFINYSYYVHLFILPLSWVNFF